MRNRTSGYLSGVLDNLRKNSARRNIHAFSNLQSFGTVLEQCSFCQAEVNVVAVLCSHGHWLFVCEKCFESRNIDCYSIPKEMVPKIEVEDCPCYRVLAEKLMNKKGIK
jgi:hypothetical protein